MAASLRQSFAHFRISRQFSKYFFYRFVGNSTISVERRLFSIAASKRGKSLQLIPSFTASNLAVQCKSKLFHAGCKCQASDVLSNDQDDPEFVTEQVFLTAENIKDLGDIIKKLKEKTGVIMKAIDGSKNGEKESKILIGGTRHEVQQATFYLKSLMDQDKPNQRLILLQDEKIDLKQSKRQEKPIWAYYRRNFKGQKPPMKTRKKCIQGKGESQIVSGNPCPICRLYLAGEYELDYKDIDLLSQFISPHTGEIFEASKTGVCKYQQENLITAIKTAKDYGLLPYSIPGPRSIEKPAQRARIPVNVKLK